MPTAEEITLTARWLVPVAGPALPGGTITYAGDWIVMVAPAGVRTADLDLGNAIILPGLVNPHTHLDLSGLDQSQLPRDDFLGWLRAIIAARQSRTPEQVQADIAFGLDQALRYGTTTIGDIAASGASWDQLSASPIRSVVYYELLGLTESRAERAWAEAQAWLAAHPMTATCQPGLSPHAPYSVATGLFQQAATAGVPLAIHLAESPEERTLLHSHTGPLVGFLKDLGVWAAEQLVPDYASLLAIFDSSQPLAWIHVNQLPAGWTPRRVYCPRTHARFGFPAYPLLTCMARGERVALATDSLASTPDLDPLAEAQCVHQAYPEVTGEQLLRMITLDAAAMLGLERVCGSLETGKAADLVVVPLPDEEASRWENLLFPANPHNLSARQVLIRGSWRAEQKNSPLS